MVVQWLRLCLPIQGVRVQSLVGKLTSHMSHGQKPKQKQYSNKFNKDSLKKKKYHCPDPTPEVHI